MSIMDWPLSAQKTSPSVQVNCEEIQLSVTALEANDSNISILDLPRLSTRRSSMSSVSWGDIDYETHNSEHIHAEPVTLWKQKSSGPWTSLIQNMGRSKKEKSLRKTAEKITIQVEPPDIPESGLHSSAKVCTFASCIDLYACVILRKWPFQSLLLALLYHQKDMNLLFTSDVL